MVRSCTSLGILLIWFALLGVDAADDSGLIDGVGDVDRCVDAVLTDLGSAVKIYNTSHVAVANVRYLLTGFGFSADFTLINLPAASPVSLMQAPPPIRQRSKRLEMLQVLLI